MDDNELLKIFWDEMRDYLGSMNTYLMALEMSLTDDDAGAFVERLRELNRLAHSMKGAARAVGVQPIETLGYYMEEVFEASLKRGLGLTPDVCDLLYDALDLVTTAADGDEIPADALHEVTEQLERAVKTSSQDLTAITVEEDDGETPPSTDPHQYIETTVAPISSDALHSFTGEDAPELHPATPPTDTSTQLISAISRTNEDTIRVAVDKLDHLMEEASELIVVRMQSEAHLDEADELRKRHNRWTREWRGVRASYIRLARRLQTEESDDLRRLFEFLELNQKYLMETSRDLNTLAGNLHNDNVRLSTLTDELQESIGSLRLVPFETVLGLIQRALRDAARETGKEVLLDVLGGSTEIDRTVLEHLKDPIMHLVRNAVDHGIEPPDVREASGKPPTGWVYINVEQRGSEIIIHIGDDGRGIDAARLRQRAVERGVITASAAQNMSDDETTALVFHPGLTTRDEVTAISGRGVGMDVVRTRVEALRGHVSLSSVPGRNTITTISVPVSLTRIRSVILTLGTEQYAVPALAVQRITRAPRADIFEAEGQTLIALGGQTLSYLDLAALLDVPAIRKADGVQKLVVISAGDRQVACGVDDVQTERELVLKRLGDELAGTRFVSGAALLGDGRVVVVLDANDLVRSTSGSLPPRSASVPVPSLPADTTPTALRVLIVDDSITTRTLEKNILENAGCDVRVAFDGVQAWETLSEHDFDLVISDVEMPRMNGLALTKRIKSTPTTRHIPVILLTSLSKPEQRAAGLEAGADAYLVKSRFDQEELLRAIQSVV
jgi:two-component system chemotaxis sensor kinase CheA